MALSLKRRAEPRPQPDSMTLAVPLYLFYEISIVIGRIINRHRIGNA
jgi:Sec-independent protein secretion pathway component TatC